MSETTILAPLDTANLLRHGLLSPHTTTGSHRIHKRRLNRSSDEEYRDIPLMVPPQSPAADDAFVTIPATLISYETLVYIGLSEAKATELWSQWMTWPSSGPRREIDADDGGLQVTFIDFVLGILENRVDTAEDNDLLWRACLETCGFNVDLQDAILDPHFKYLRLSESCLYWAKDTIEMRYAGLEDIQRSSREREIKLRQAASRPTEHSKVLSRDGQEGDLNLSTSSSSSTGHGEGSISGAQQQSTPGIGQESWGSASAIAARNAPGHTVLFKAIDQGRIAGLFNEAGTLDRIDTLLSPPPSDFSGTRSLFYFMPDYQVAQYYAAYAKWRANCESVVVVCLHIPNFAIESLTALMIQHISWPSSEWKELVWRSRTQQPLPSHLRKYRQAVLVIGTTSRKPGFVYHKMGSWEAVTEDCILRVGSNQNNPAVQYVFSGEEEGHEFLVEHGGQDIKVFSYPQFELQAWLAEN